MGKSCQDTSCIYHLFWEQQKLSQKLPEDVYLCLIAQNCVTFLTAILSCSGVWINKFSFPILCNSSSKGNGGWKCLLVSWQPNRGKSWKTKLSRQRQSHLTEYKEIFLSPLCTKFCGRQHSCIYTYHGYLHHAFEKAKLWVVFCM